LPRARLVSGFQLVDSLPQQNALGPFLDAIQQGDIPVAEQVVLAHKPDPLPVATDDLLPVPVFLVDDLDEVIVRTQAKTPSVLVLADMHTSGWRAYIDDQPAELLLADLVLRAVAVPAGEHEVRFLFHDPSVRAGLNISLIGLAGVLVLLLFPLVRHRRHRALTTEDDRDE